MSGLPREVSESRSPPRPRGQHLSESHSGLCLAQRNPSGSHSSFHEAVNVSALYTRVHMDMHVHVCACVHVCERQREMKGVCW